MPVYMYAQISYVWEGREKPERQGNDRLFRFWCNQELFDHVIIVQLRDIFHQRNRKKEVIH